MIIVHVTCKNTKEAEKIAREVVGSGLAACANYRDCRSIYFWKGKLVKEKETVLELKTVEHSYRLLEQRIRKLHSYELPCIVASPVQFAEPNYLRWVQHYSTGRKPIQKAVTKKKRRKA